MRKIHRTRLSDHAYARYLERFGEEQREAVLARVMGGGGKKWLACGAVRLWNHRGMHIVADRGTVITLWPVEWGKRG